jgi:hypothetical protein
MCLQRAPEKYIAGAVLDRAGVDDYIVLSEVIYHEESPKPLFSDKIVCGSLPNTWLK